MIMRKGVLDFFVLLFGGCGRKLPIAVFFGWELFLGIQQLLGETTAISRLT
jgi:hypothetical protein